MSITALNLSHITYTYPGAPEPILEDVTVTFAPGWTAVLGDNGIGKSTLMHIAQGSLTPERGQVSPSDAVIAFCPQDVAVVPANLDDFAGDWSPETIAIRDTLGIADDWPYRYDTLSGGERKRLQIACALALQPDVLILDEPTNHVDATTRAPRSTSWRNSTPPTVATCSQPWPSSTPTPTAFSPPPANPRRVNCENCS
ncbi:ATP-binding cassette domain-containing protein [Bifidobacterium thermophilum]|nr:ATP-binding cassette domain-containing protein [Bifidobacterium thermophilum]